MSSPEPPIRWRSFVGRAWRIVSPRWHAAPLSGEGAALFGGRFNAEGVPALYLALDHTTAFAEYQQDIGVRPGTFFAYRVAARRLVDLSDDETLSALGITSAQLHVPWKKSLLVQHKTPATVEISRKLISMGAQGAIYASTRFPSGLNMVLWRWNVRNGAKAVVHDPASDIPAS